MSENRCVCCGEVIPDGTQVCGNCQKDKTMKQYSKIEKEADMLQRNISIKTNKELEKTQSYYDGYNQGVEDMFQKEYVSGVEVQLKISEEHHAVVKNALINSI